MTTRTRKTARRQFTATSEDIPVTQRYHSSVVERDRIIMGFSDCELLKFHQIGGKVPRQMIPRLERVLAAQIAEVAMEAGEPFEGYGPEAGCEVPWTESCSVERGRRRRRKRQMRRTARANVTAFLASLEAA